MSPHTENNVNKPKPKPDNDPDQFNGRRASITLKKIQMYYSMDDDNVKSAKKRDSKHQAKKDLRATRAY